MQLYDKDIREIQRYIKDISSRNLYKENMCYTNSWPLADKEELILKCDMAYELGGGNYYAVSGLAFTFDSDVVRKSSVMVIGPDLTEINGDCSYARITLIRLSDRIMNADENELYRVLKKINYVRYHIYPKGYMMRISSVNEREPVRIAASALKNKISLFKLGAAFNAEYEKQPEVEAVQTIFITDTDADYKWLKSRAHKFEMITESLNHIYENLKMDCSVCNLKPVCDEVEGLREMHMHHLDNAK